MQKFAALMAKSLTNDVWKVHQKIINYFENNEILQVVFFLAAPCSYIHASFRTLCCSLFALQNQLMTFDLQYTFSLNALCLAYIWRWTGFCIASTGLFTWNSLADDQRQLIALAFLTDHSNTILNFSSSPTSKCSQFGVLRCI